MREVESSSGPWMVYCADERDDHHPGRFPRPWARTFADKADAQWMILEHASSTTTWHIWDDHEPEQLRAELEGLAVDWDQLFKVHGRFHWNLNLADYQPGTVNGGPMPYGEWLMLPERDRDQWARAALGAIAFDGEETIALIPAGIDMHVSSIGCGDWIRRGQDHANF